MSERQAELLPCPFCGGDNVTTFGPYGWYRQWGISHSCSSFYSGAQEMFKGFPAEANAISAWNTRATPKSSEGEALRALRTIASIIGNVDHSRGGGANAASMYGEMLNDIRAIAHDAAAKAGATHA